MATSTEESGGVGTPTDLVDAFRASDVAALARLTAAEREEHERGRARLFRSPALDRVDRAPAIWR